MTAVATRTAACSCGALAATATGEPDIVAMCSCAACQRRTGTSFGLYAWWPDAAVTVSGEARRWARTSDRGRVWETFFCPTCGSIVSVHSEPLAGKTGIPGGAFADPAFPPPQVAVWDTTRHTWLDALDAIPRMAEQRS